MLDLVGNHLLEEVVIKLEYNESLVRGGSLHAIVRRQVLAVDSVLCSVMQGLFR